MSTVYLFGAGFSKDVACGPLMRECYARMKEKYEEDCRVLCERPPKRIEFFEIAENVIRRLEEIAKQRFCVPDQIVGSDLRENLEGLYTFAEIACHLGYLSFRDGLREQLTPLAGIGLGDLKALMGCVHAYLGAILSPLGVTSKKKSVFSTFAKRFDLNSDVLATFNYDLVLEKELWALGCWSPRCGYPGIEEFYPVEVRAEHITRVSRCKIIKLHGSVNWGWQSPGSRSMPRAMLFDTEKDGRPWLFDGFDDALPAGVRDAVYRYPGPPREFRYELAVAPSLVKPVGSSCELAQNWRAIQNALVRADCVISVGYSFPEQDPASRLLTLLIRDGVPLVIVDPKAGTVANALSGLVHNLVPLEKTFSDWVDAGCPREKTPS